MLGPNTSGPQLSAELRNDIVKGDGKIKTRTSCFFPLYSRIIVPKDDFNLEDTHCKICKAQRLFQIFSLDYYIQYIESLINDNKYP